MENLCHTFAGAALGKTGLERLTPLAMPTLLIAANLPDLDIIAMVDGPVAYLEHHRGITHSLAGVVALGLVLAIAMLLFDRGVRRRWRPARPPVRFGGLIVVSLIGTASHTLLDYTNAYGIRPYLPWSSRWMYGDLVFIVDPWLWVILGGTVFLLTSHSRSRQIGWGLLWGVMTMIVFGAHLALTRQQAGPLGLAWLWMVLLAGLVIAKQAGFTRFESKLAVGGLVAACVYWVFLGLMHEVALDRTVAASHVVSDGRQTSRHAALPRPATPFQWDAMFETPTDILYGVVAISTPPGQDWPVQRVPKRLDDEYVQQALQTCAGSTMLQFSRYLFAEVESSTAGTTVHLRDARFERQRSPGFATVSIPLNDTKRGTE